MDIDGLSHMNLAQLDALERAIFDQREALHREECHRRDLQLAPSLVGKVLRQLHEEYDETGEKNWYVPDNTYLTVLSHDGNGKVEVIEFSFLKDGEDDPQPHAFLSHTFRVGDEYSNGGDRYFHYEEVPPDDPGFKAVQEAVWNNLRYALRS